MILIQIQGRLVHEVQFNISLLDSHDNDFFTWTKID